MPRTELIRIPCTTGINQASGIQGGGFSACENFRSGGTGEALVKRTGLKRYSGFVGSVDGDSSQYGPQITGDGTTTAVENCSFLANCGSQNVIGTSSGAVFELNDDSGNFVFAGRVSTCKPLRRERFLVGGKLDLANGYYGLGATPPQCAVNSDGYTLVCAKSTAPGTDFLQIYNPDKRLVGSSLGLIGGNPKVVAQGSAFYVVYEDNTTPTEIYAAPVVFDDATYTEYLSMGVAVKAADLRAEGDPWDVCYGYSYSASANRWWLVYQFNATYVKVGVFNGTSSVNVVLHEIGGVADHLSIQHVPIKTSASPYSNVFVGDNQSGTLSGSVLTEGVGSATLANQQIATGLTAPGPPLFGIYYPDGPGNTTKAFVLYRDRITATDATTVWKTYIGSLETDGTVVNSATHILNGVLPISKLDNYGRFWVLLGSELDESLMRCALVRAYRDDDGIPALELAAERSLAVDVATYGPAADPAWFGQIGQGSDFSVYPLPFIIGDYNGVPQYALDLMFYACSEHDPHLSTSRCATVVTAGQPHETGLRIKEDVGLDNEATHGSAEIGWPTRPIILDVVLTEGASPLGAGDRDYVVVMEYVDRFGRRHLSEPSLPFSVTFDAQDNQAALYFITSKLSVRNSATGSYELVRPRALIYRTVANGTTLQKLPGYEPVMETAVIHEYYDLATDDDIADEQPLYTSGGVLPNDLAPACQFVTRVADRIWCGGLWEPTVIQCSKTIIPTEPINFADSDVYRVQLSGECTGLAGMDGRVVAFTQNTIETVSGDGPDNRGSGYFSPPEIVTSSIGCTNFRSVVATDVGVFFQSGPGFFVLPRGFGPVQHVGDMIRDHVLTGDAAYCWASAVSAVGTDQVAAWLTSTDSGTTPSTLLVYDITRNLWFMDTLDGGPYRELGAWSSGLALCTANLDSDDVSTPIAVQRSNSADTTDDGSTFLDAQVSTDTMHPFGVGGWGWVHSITVVFTGSGFDLNIDIVAEDHSQSASWTISSSDVINHRTMSLEHPKLSALSIDVYDSDGSTDLSFSPLAIVLSVTPAEGIRPPDAGERDGG